MSFSDRLHRRLPQALLAMSLTLALTFITVRSGAPIPHPTGDAGAGPSPAEVAGKWVGYASHGGETSPVVLELQVAAGGEIQARWSTPAIHLWDLPVGKAAIRDHEVRIGPMALTYDRAAGTLTGTLPDAFAPVYHLQVTFRRGSFERTPRPEPAARVAAPVWSFDAAVPIWSDLAFAGGVLYVGADDGRLYALAARTGMPLWELRTGGAIRARPTVSGGDVFVQSDDGFLYRLEAATGARRWRVRVAAPVKRLSLGQEGSRYDNRASAATLAGGRLVLGTDDGHVLALDPANGSKLWDFTAGGSVSSTPAVDSGRVYFGSFDGHVYGLAAASGTLLWQHDTGGAVTTAPALFEGRVIIGSRSYDLAALDGASGKPLWTRYYWFSWVESPAAVFGGTAYVGSSDAAKLYAFDARTGRRVWETDAGGSAWGQPAVTDKRVFIGIAGTLNYLVAHRGSILAVDRATGLPAWRFPVAAPTAATSELTEYGFAASPAIGEGLVFFAGLDGRVLAFAQE
jgi:outer membrane protein assembly factor BamB